jgi:hypothetical protein
VRPARRALWAAGAGVLLALAACSRAERHPVTRLEVQGATVEDNALLGLDGAEVDALFRDALRRHGRFELDPPARPADGRAVTMVLEIPFTRESVKAGRAGSWAEVGVRLALRRKVESVGHRYDVTGLGEVEVQQGDRHRAMRRALEKALAAVAEAAHLQLQALTRPDGELLAELNGRGPGRDYALRVLAERQNPAVAEALIDRVKNDEDPDRVREAMGALAEMREARAVRPLIEATRGREPAFVREVVFALAQIGGQEAMAYVFTVAQGHDDPAVRDAANKALHELEQRERAQAAREGKER